MNASAIRSAANAMMARYNAPRNDKVVRGWLHLTESAVKGYDGHNRPWGKLEREALTIYKGLLLTHKNG